MNDVLDLAEARPAAARRPCPQVQLRPLIAADFDLIFEHLNDPVAVRMAGFTLPDPSNRAEFDAVWRKVLAHPSAWVRAVVADGRFAGHIACYQFRPEREVGYWIGRRWWGRGVATAALRLLLAQVPHRPLAARVPHDNPGSVGVLHKCGFAPRWEERAFACGRGEEVGVQVLVLD